MLTLKECGSDYLKFLGYEDDTWIFTKGACHAFALELIGMFQNQERVAELFYIATGHQELADHVVVKSNNHYCDVFGRNASDALVTRWAKAGQFQLLPIGHEGWLTHSNQIPNMSYLGLFVDPVFLQQARLRARTYISSHASLFSC